MNTNGCRHEPELPVKAKWIIAGVLGVGSLAIFSATFKAEVEPLRLLPWAFAAAIAGAAKVRFSRINSCYSLGFIVVLAAMVALSLAETAVIAVIAAVRSVIGVRSRRPALSRCCLMPATTESAEQRDGTRSGSPALAAR